MKWIAAVIAVACIVALFRMYGTPEAKLAVLHVKEGQCWIYRGKDGGVAVINCHSDAVPDYSARTALDVLQKWGVNRVDAFICLQPFCSSVGGIAERFPKTKLLRAWGLKDGQKIALNDSDLLTIHADDQGVYGISGREGFLLVSRLPANLPSESAYPNVLAIGWTSSLNPQTVPDKLEADCVVLHSSKTRAQWADYGLVRHFKSASDELIQTGRDGGVIFTYKSGKLIITRTAR